MQIFWNKKLSLPEISKAKTLSLPEIYTSYISHSIPRKQAGNFFPTVHSVVWAEVDNQLP